MACLRAKKFLIFHHSVSFVMENCTIYQTSETSLWGDIGGLNSSVESFVIMTWLKNLVCFGLIQLNSDHFKGESWFITVVQDLISESRGLQFPDTLLSMMIYTALVGINGKFLFSWVQLSLISPLQPPAVLTMPVKQNCSMILPPSNT